MLTLIGITLATMFIGLPILVMLSGIIIRFTIRLVLLGASLVILFFIAKFLLMGLAGLLLMTDVFKLTNTGLFF